MTLLALVLAATVQSGSAEERAVEFLAREVPAWPNENHCFSCHNNGDAARALFAAVRADHVVPEASLDATLDWLADPSRWDHQKGEEAFSDTVLARIQFASALVDAASSGLINDPGALIEAAALVASDQSLDGSWQLDDSGSIGSPATYGPFLATATARRVLARSNPERHRNELSRADRYLRQVEVKTVLGAAAVLDAMADAVDPAAVEQRNRCLALVERGEAPSGGWGPYLTSRPEPFDTAVVLIALERAGARPELVARGRRFLLDQQLADGSWVETTRPAGQTSYAQYISTTGWALLALLETSPDEP